MSLLPKYIPFLIGDIKKPIIIPIKKAVNIPNGLHSNFKKFFIKNLLSKIYLKGALFKMSNKTIINLEMQFYNRMGYIEKIIKRLQSR